MPAGALYVRGAGTHMSAKRAVRWSTTFQGSGVRPYAFLCTLGVLL
jgi:hypothetical protein